ncbi:MAG: phosphomannomutase/phosphoglucomutase [Candidatus Uhrbacteria bacterium]|nr:phosphomannomutase/phosphoglucomutase [Candidatus Uhrbacteria bacterium]
MNPSIFKAYDIRGVVPDDVNEEVVERIGRAFATHLRKETGKEIVTIAVGQDNRTHSPLLFSALTKGLMDAGANVIDIGLASTPFFYFAVSHLGLDGGINVTASHNPPQYNGLKCVRKRAEPIGMESGMTEIQKLASGTDPLVSENKGTMSTQNILSDYIKKNLELVPALDYSGLKIAIDTGNGVSALMIQEFIDAVHLPVVPLYFELDGTFPNHLPNPLVEENVADLKKAIIDNQCHCGVALDADGDRMIFIDERGVMANDVTIALLAQGFLARHPGEKILYDIRSSHTVPETIRESGGVPVATPVGHTLIKQCMRKENGLFAGELSGHYYFRDIGTFEAPLMALATVLNLLATSGKKLSELVNPLRRYFDTGEINFTVDDKDAIMKEIESTYHDAKNSSHLDGVTIEYDDWWCNVRPSNTEPLLRLNLEARSEELRDVKLKEITAIIQSI